MNGKYWGVWLLLGLLPGLLLPLGMALAQDETNPRSDYWREVRQGVQGYTAVRGQETGVLIQNAGQNWRQLRNGPVATYGGWLLGLVVVAIGGFYLVVGRVRLEHGRVGMRMLRWRPWERALHWTTAVVFILMAITGLSILFGRAVLIPVLGKEAFAAYLAAGKLLHNVLGPVLLACVLVEFLAWVKYNLPQRRDLDWFAKGGGIAGHGHPSAGRMNGGEKAWFWVVFFVGFLLVGISGLVLDFPNFGQTREVMQAANLVHSIAAIVWLCFALGHIYIGTLGSEGSLEAMTTGYVDVNWAKQHHDVWFEEEMAKPRARRKLVDSGATGAGRSGAPEPRAP